MHTLIVEDDTSSRLLIEAVLRDHGHEIHACSDAETALDLCARQEFQLAVLDWMLPGIDGLELCQQLRALPWGDLVFILVITSRTSGEQLKTILSAGADDFLAKPIDPTLFGVRLTIAEHHYEVHLERRRAEEALQESELRYRDLIEHVPCGVYESTPEGALLSINPALVRMLGFDAADELLGVDIGHDLYLDRSERKRLLEQLEDQGSLSNAEIRLRRRDGSIVTLLENAMVKRSSSADRPITYQGTLVDITVRKQIEEQLRQTHDELELRVNERTAELATVVRELQAEVAERKRIQEALQQSELDYRGVFENAHDAIIVYSVDDEVVLDVNQRGCEVYGYRRKELIGKPLAVLTGAHSGPGAGSNASVRPGPGSNASVRPGGESEHGGPPHGETTQYRKDGAPITIDVNTTPIHYQGRPAILSINRDITERRVLEHRLRQAQKLEALGQLAGTIAHDFNNLVTAILGTSELLQRRLGDDHPVAGDLALIGRASRSAADLTRSLLAYARQRMLQPIDLDLNELVREILPVLRRLLPDGISLQHRAGRGLGNVHADRSQMEQVIMNLVTNARDAMSDGGSIIIKTGNRRISSAYVEEHPWAVEGSYVFVAVSDDGIGMDEATRTQIFDIFFTTKEAGKGCGLGLASVYGSVKQHGGMIEVTSEPAAGSTFTVLLPKHELRLEKAPEVGAGLARRGAETVLVVEDYDDLREVVVDSVQSLGYRTLQASDGIEALEILQDDDSSVQMVVTDMTMPRMGGFELFQRSRAIDPDLAFIFCTGHAGEWEDLTEFEDARAAYLEKPFSIDTLAEKIREVLDRPV